MEPVFALAFGVMVAVAAYLLMSRNVLRVVLGLLEAMREAEPPGEGGLPSPASPPVTKVKEPAR